jgi:hypothetical protein
MTWQRELEPTSAIGTMAVQVVGEELSGDILNIEERPNGLEMMPGWGIARTNVPPD